MHRITDHVSRNFISIHIICIFLQKLNQTIWQCDPAELSDDTVHACTRVEEAGRF